MIVNFLYSLEISQEGLSSVPITGGYSNVFEEVTGLPLYKETKFLIDLVKEVRPIVMPMRCMAPKEKKELKVQANDLLRRGSI